MVLKRLGDLISKSIRAWVADFAPSMGAALAYYTLFSIAPLLIIVVAVAGLFFGQEAARGEIFAQIQGVIGSEGAILIQGLLKSANEPAKDVFAMILSVIMLMIGATTVFGENGGMDFLLGGKRFSMRLISASRSPLRRCSLR